VSGLDEATLRTLRMLARTRSRKEMETLFAAIRAESDRALLAAAAPPQKKKAAAPDFAAKIAEQLAPILGPATEKAEMLIDALAETQGPVSVVPAGLVPTIRRLVARYGEHAVSHAAGALMTRLATWGSTRERVT
jgi:hypothetical protein